PVSYATAAYFGVNSFAFVDNSGRKRFVRYRFVPVAGEHYLDAAGLAGKGPNYLQEEIAARVTQAPVAFEWFAQLAEAGDAIENADPMLTVRHAAYPISFGERQ